VKRSTDRILVTHIGSLPRPPELLTLAIEIASGNRQNETRYRETLRTAVADVVRRQVAQGIDVIDDGEFGKLSFLTYVNDRLGGYEPDPGKSRSPWAGSREVAAFPNFYRPQLEGPSARAVRLVCTAPITYKGHDQLQRDLKNLKDATRGAGAKEAFMPSISPANIEWWNANRHYSTQEEYVFAIASAMAAEYKAIVDAGFLVQIDDPQLVMEYMLQPEMSIAQCREWAEIRVEALNLALKDIPRDRIRYHTCYGINMGPRVSDMELKDIIDIVLKVKAGAYSFEHANPRHEHEWVIWKKVKLPNDAILIPGVVTQSSVVVEHPELVAERLRRFADAVGRENVIAGADCGFASFAAGNEIDEAIVWAKLGALVEGARLATEQLWG
jgi:5-methyltetrahydropteroyltriglutamate--homocysteine methyltransferase